MKKRVLVILLTGVFIIGGASASASVDIKCVPCDGDGKQECLVCEGVGGFVFPAVVECGCRRDNPDCPFCRGKGAYISFGTGACLGCEGRGGESCPHCGGRGK